MYPILALVWLIVAGLLFYWSWAQPERAYVIPGTEISLGWLALAMLAYNLLRWWSLRRWQQSHRRPLVPPRRTAAPPDEDSPFRDLSG